MLRQRQLTLEDYLTILRRRRWWILIPALLGPALGLLLAIVLPKQYTSKTLVLVEEPKVPEAYVKPVVSVDVSTRLATMQEQILSRTRLVPLIERFGLFKKSMGRVPLEELITRMRKDITVQPVQPLPTSDTKGIQGFTISFTADQPKLAQDVCREITSMFITENLRHREQTAMGTTEFLERQLADAKRVLDAKDAKLAEFKRRYIGQLPDQEQTNLQVLLNLRAQLEATTEALNRATQDKAYSESMLQQQLAAWKASQGGNSAEPLEQELAKQQSQLLILEAHYTSEYPDLIKLKNDIAELHKKIAERNAIEKVESSNSTQSAPGVEPASLQQFRAMIQQAEQTIKLRTKEQENFQEQIRMYQARIQLSPTVEEQYKNLTRDYQTALDFYNELLKKRDQSQMATDLERQEQGEQFLVMDPANLPEKPSFPNLPLFGAGGLAGGLTIGLGLVLLLEIRDQSMWTESDVELCLGLPTLALIPSIEPNEKGKEKHVPENKEKFESPEGLHLRGQGREGHV